MKYNFNQVVDRRGTYCTQWDYARDRFGHDDVLPFSISDMDFPLPEEMVKYLEDDLKSGIYGYTRWRNPELLASISNWYQRQYQTEINEDTIMYSPTVIFTLAEMMRLKSEKNDGVLLFNPSYDAFFGLIRENERQLVTSELLKKENYYEIDRDDFEAKIKKVKILILCSPHNPVGKVWTAEELAYIIKICKENNVFIISDEIHMDMCFTKPFIPLISIAREYQYAKNMVIATSATKSFNFPALLFSYVIIEDKELYQQFEVKLKYANGLSSCTRLGMKATMYVYNHLDQWLVELKNYIYENYQIVKQFMSENGLKVNVSELEGTYLLWLDVSKYDSAKLIDIMYNQTKVGIMSGDVYGTEGYLRINIGCPKVKLIKGLERFKAAIDILSE